MEQHRRLKVLELNLSPYQIVLLWVKDATKRTLEEWARQHSESPGAIANSVATAVRSSFKGQPEAVVERAIRQARKEADLLYHLVMRVNFAVQEHFLARRREYNFLLAYLYATITDASTSEDLVVAITRLFIGEIIVLHSAVLEVSAERFGGQNLLFSDSASQLKEQLNMLDEVLRIFNIAAHGLNFKELTAEMVRAELHECVDPLVSCWVTGARLWTLATLGEQSDFRAAFLGGIDQLAAH
jgi:hypothetical protein